MIINIQISTITSRLNRYLVFTFLSLILLSLFSCKHKSSLEKPNIIYILADDLGYGELGVYGQEKIETPHIDKLASNGMVFTQYYSGAPVCAPARCVLLTGQHTGNAYVRGNDEWGERGKVWDYQAMSDDPYLEGQRPLPDSIITIAEMLQEAGYKTGMVGKWGLGAPTTEGVPNNQGFDFFYGYNCQRQAHTYYPMHLWKNEEKDPLNNKFVKLHANMPENADPYDLNSYQDFNLNEYAPDRMHQEALQFIDRNQEQPFFLYYASPIPHLPLQAPQKWIDHYLEKYGEEEPFTGNSYFPCRYPRATYAAMITYLDEQVGELVEALRQKDLLHNTLIIFTSDNGPTYTGGADTPFFDSAKPFKTEYGWGKGFTHEGGIRVPMIASWPGKIETGSRSDHISAFHDVYPTLCEIAGVTPRVPIDGISFLPAMMDQEQESHEYLFWDFPEYGGQQAVRMGKWKGIRKNIKKGNLSIELYDLSSDIREQNNVADVHPEIVQKIEKIMREARTEPSIDRFKMESLGDVKNSVKQARNRLETMNTASVVTNDEYFTLTKNSILSISNRYVEFLENFQDRLEVTGGYKLKTDETKEPDLSFTIDGSIKSDGFKLKISKEKIEVEAGGNKGLSQAVNYILNIMDPKINVDHEMHNPTWVIAGGIVKT